MPLTSSRRSSARGSLITGNEAVPQPAGRHDQRVGAAVTVGSMYSIWRVVASSRASRNSGAGTSTSWVCLDVAIRCGQSMSPSTAPSSAYLRVPRCDTAALLRRADKVSVAGADRWRWKRYKLQGWPSLRSCRALSCSAAVCSRRLAPIVGQPVESALKVAVMCVGARSVSETRRPSSHLERRCHGRIYLTATVPRDR